MRYRHGRQPGPRRQFAQHSPKIGRFIRVQRACAIQPQGQPGSRRRFEQQGEPAAASASHRALSPNSRLPATAAIPSRVSTNSAVCRRLSQRCRAPAACAWRRSRWLIWAFPSGPVIALAAASKSPRGPASRLRAPRSWRGWSPGRGSRTCAPGRSARSGSAS